MKAQQSSFRSLVDDAAEGKLRLPEFQRDWKWRRSQVVRLYDSIRKDYPIGAFLTLEASDKLNFSPRPFTGVETIPEDLEAYVLDGQQRITAGLALYKGMGGTHYFLNLETIWTEVQNRNLDLTDRGATARLADDLDEDSGIIVPRRRSNNPREHLTSSHLLWTPDLADKDLLEDAKERYVARFPERERFFARIIGNYFRIDAGPTVPVTVLDAGMPVEAITRVFATLNTSGSALTPVEIVVAILYASDIHLRKDLEEFRDLSPYYRNIDRSGELLLQTIALLSKENPKRSSLPRTITPINYRRYRNDALDALDRAGDFLSKRFGAGVDQSAGLIPYPAMIPPLGLALASIDNEFSGPSPEREQWYRYLERWFVGTCLAQRYRESQPAMMERDHIAFEKWITTKGKEHPSWLDNVLVGPLDNIKPSSAIGNLITMLINRNSPKDPLNKELVGGSGVSNISSQRHHIFPKAFCEDHLSGWSASNATWELSMNTMSLTGESNRRWTKMDPASQVRDVSQKWEGEEEASFAPFFIDKDALEILSRQDKSLDDFRAFIAHRSTTLQTHISQEWGFSLDDVSIEDEEDE